MRRGFVCSFSLLILFFAACKTPPVPPEVKESETQEHALWKAGAPVYIPEDYIHYMKSLREARDKLIQENAKFIWFRKYQPVQSSFQTVLEEGKKLEKKIQELKEFQSAVVLERLAAFQKRIDAIRKYTPLINQGRFARSILIRAELMMREAQIQGQKGDFKAALKKLEDIHFYIADAEDLVSSVLERFKDEAAISRWMEWARETLLESRVRGTAALIVSKIDRELLFIRKGQLVGSFPVGLGRNGFQNKIHAGDYATPEGRYRIIKKNPASNYYKALLIDYPNSDDKRHFALAKKTGSVPPGVGIGGMIEIHGGGKDSLTDGCISLENTDMDTIYKEVEVGTPVTIVGALKNLSESLGLQDKPR